jgi:hypothetical protein
MLPYQPNSDALVPPPAWRPLLAEPVFPAPLLDADSVFAKALFSFLSDFSLDFTALVFIFGDGLGDAFANSVFFGDGFGIGFGVVFGFGVSVAVGLGVDTPVGAGDGNSISLFAVITAGFSSSSFDGFDSSSGLGGLADDGDSFADSPTAKSSVPPNQTMLSGFDEALAAWLQRISPAISATCANVIRITFRQKRALATTDLCEDGAFAIYFFSAFVAMPTLVIPARCTASISPTSFCTGKSRSGRITMATSGFACFNSVNCAVSVSKPTT